MNKPNNCIIFARISTEIQSNESQVNVLREYAKQKKYKVKEVFEEVKSGYATKEERKVVQEFEEYIKENHAIIKHVLFFELSRIGRRAIDILHIIQECFDLGINVYIKQNDMNTFKINSKGDLEEDYTNKMLITQMAAFAEYEGAQIKSRTRRGKKNLITKGFWQGGVPPFGFAVNNKNELIEHPTNAKIVREIYQRYNDGEGSNSIIDWLHEEGIKTRYNKTIWNESAVRQMISNEIYNGRRYYKGDKDFIIPCPTIIDDEIWQTAYNKLKNNPIQQHKRKFDYVISTKRLKCSCCSSIMNYINNKRNSVLKCKQFKYKIRCNNFGFNIPRFYNVIYSLMDYQKSFVNIYEQEDKKDEIERKITYKKDEIERLKKELVKAEKNNIKIKEDFYGDNPLGLNNDEVKKIIGKNNSNIAKHNKNIAKLKAEITELKAYNFEQWLKFEDSNKFEINNNIQNALKEVVFYPIHDSNYNFTDRNDDNIYLLNVKLNPNYGAKNEYFILVSRFSKYFLWLDNTTEFDFSGRTAQYWLDEGYKLQIFDKKTGEKKKREWNVLHLQENFNHPIKKFEIKDYKFLWDYE
ncbi:recombinase family protein [Marinifilum fragile]|uniref:recombinase family protein n=1 Tax=Marinifilum fragile TaxID=570161 RepID=UPI002AA88612|nr:recombinase family protein [Marinifilum fragile]